MYEEETINSIDSVEQVLEEMETEKKPTKKSLFQAAAMVTIVVIAGFFIVKDRDASNVATEEETTPVLTVNDFFEPLEIEAEAYAVFNVLSGELVYSKSEELQLPLASLSKVMTAYVASEYLNNDSVVVINPQDLLIEGDSGLLANEKWNFDDIRDFTLVISSNDGSKSLASAVEALNKTEEVSFIQLMNRKAEDLGLKQTYFLNTSGLDIQEETQSGSYGSAKDMAVLFGHVLLEKPEIFEATTEEEFAIQSLDSIEHIAVNTNQTVRSITGLIGSKTGFTDLAGGNLVIAYDAGLMQPYVIAVLGSSKEGRFTDVAKLHKATGEFISYSQ